MNAKVFKVCSKSFEILLCESLWMLLWTYIFRGNTILIILFILFDSDMIEGIIYYLKEIDQRHSEVGVNFLGNLPVQLFLDNYCMHILNLDVDHAAVEAFSSYHQ